MSNEKRTRRICASLALMVLTSTTILTGMGPAMTQAADEEQAPATSSVLVTPSLDGTVNAGDPATGDDAEAETPTEVDTEDAVTPETPAGDYQETEEAQVAPEASAPAADTPTSEVVTEAAAASAVAPADTARAGVIADGTWGSVDWVVDEDGQLILQAGTGDDIAWQAPWGNVANSVTKVIFDGEVIAPADSSNLFSGLTNVTEYAHIDRLKTSQVTNMYGMFAHNNSLKSLSLEGFDVSNVTEMGYLFAHSGLEHVDLSSWDFYPYVNVYWAFVNASSLQSVDFGDATFANIQSPFKSNDQLQTLILGSETMIEGVPLPAGMKWEGQRTGHSFYSRYTGGAADTYTLVEAETDGVWGNVAWSLDDEGTLTLEGGQGNNTGGYSPWETLSSQINKVVINGDVQMPSDSSALFRNMENLETIENSHRLDMSQVDNMRQMFSGDKNLQTLDVGDWNTENVANMSALFEDCYSLSEIDVSGWQVGNVEDFSMMFSYANSLHTLPLEKWQVQDYASFYRFAQGTSVETIDLSQWKAEDIYLGYAFTQMPALRTIDLSGLNLSDGGYTVIDYSNRLESVVLGDQSSLGDFWVPDGQVWVGDRTGHQFGRYYNGGFADTYRLADGELGYVSLVFEDHTADIYWSGQILYGQLGEKVDLSQAELPKDYELVNPNEELVFEPLDEYDQPELKVIGVKQIPKITTRRITFTGLPEGTLKDEVQEVKWHWDWDFGEDEWAEWTRQGRRADSKDSWDAALVYLPQGHYEAYTVPTVAGYKAEVTTVEALHIDTSNPITELSHADDVTVHFTKLATDGSDSNEGDADTGDDVGDSSAGGSNSGSGTSAGSSTGSGHSTTTSGNLPQTGTVAATGLTALGLGLLGMLGISWRKRRKG
ncbi:MAG: DUF285 domain-containing protein [Lactobacillus sp.]|nr:DUF285 domain-containing protein [Lactobacillus sp.]MCI1917849.1 DUF285 domain-containing protein [Lactobacillus sp.]MCI1941909.1 DUF285 domain-containing protein [Lactobacillus sp.]MCI1972839.1 DUF285 domain-containing protein [Lactobacillus sp.]